MFSGCFSERIRKKRLPLVHSKCILFGRELSNIKLSVYHLLLINAPEHGPRQTDRAGCKEHEVCLYLGRNAPERILLCKPSLMAMALPALSALHLLALLAAGILHPGRWRAALTAPEGSRAWCRGDNTPRRPLRACPESKSPCCLSNGFQRR